MTVRHEGVWLLLPAALTVLAAVSSTGAQKPRGERPTYRIGEGARSDDSEAGGAASRHACCAEYVEQQVSQKSRAVGGKQNPVMKGELEGVLPLVKIGR